MASLPQRIQTSLGDILTLQREIGERVFGEPRA
jgi:hypothetical protein